jgi:hypothetical protein
MAGTSGRRSRAASIQIQAIDQVNASLQDLPEKPKDNLSLREAVNLLQDEIRVALAKGYTHEDLAAIFADQGIEISALTLKRYVSSGRGQTPKTKTTTGRRGRRPRAEAIEEEPTLPLVEVEPEAEEPEEVEEPTPAPSGRRRRTSAAKAQADSEADEAAPKRTTSGRGRASTRATQSTSRTRRKSTK